MTTATATQSRSTVKTSPHLTKDAELVQDVHRALIGTGYPQLLQVRVDIHEGLVILHGSVTTYYQKQLAQETAKHVDGVELVTSEIAVL